MILKTGSKSCTHRHRTRKKWKFVFGAEKNVRMKVKISWRNMNHASLMSGSI